MGVLQGRDVQCGRDGCHVQYEPLVRQEILRFGMPDGNTGMADIDGSAPEQHGKESRGVHGGRGMLPDTRSDGADDSACVGHGASRETAESEQSCHDGDDGMEVTEYTSRPMPKTKRPIGVSVLYAARDRIAKAFDLCEKIYVSFSAGKDSTVMLHLVAEEARKRRQKFAVLLIDLEAQYTLTIDHAEKCRAMYADCSVWYWVCLPISLRNAVSMFHPQWMCWEHGREKDWVRMPPTGAITDPSTFDWFTPGMEFEEFVPLFGQWYSEGKRTACFVGIRTDESLNRFRTIASQSKERLEGLGYTTKVIGEVFNFYPVYDWRTEDLWTWHARNPGMPHNRLYDLMHKAGLSIHQMRICQPYGDDQRRGLWLYHLIEPHTWGKVVARVNGANSGAIYVQESGNMTGYRAVTLPPGHTWKSFASLLLKSLPTKTAEHFRAKIDVHRKWWMERGYDNGIPDASDPKLEAKKEAPSWRRVCKAILRNDYWCKTLGFTQHKSGCFDRYLKMMAKRRQKAEWQFRD